MSNLDIGIDLGTANIIVTCGNKGIIINEPSVVAVDTRKRKVIKIGEEAYKMIGRTPEYIMAVHPLKDGVISDNVMAEALVKEYVQRVSGNMLVKPRVIICVPSSVTDVETRAIVEAAIAAGSRKVFLIEEPIAALLGAGVDISKASGNMIVDIGGGTTDIAVISMGGIVISRSVKIAGNKFDTAIINYIRNTYQLYIGEKTAEKAKKNIVNVFEPSGELNMIIKGRHLARGLPESIVASDIDMWHAVGDIAMDIVLNIKSVFEKTPPELAGDIIENGIILTGGTALLGGLDKLIEYNTGIRCYIADSPLECVALGISKAFNFTDELRDGFVKIPAFKYK